MNPVINDFAIKIATVNGSGSQTANTALMKCFFKMNIPVGSKNYFPSNIQGMPTWFSIRVNDKGFIGPRQFTDILINYNAKTLEQDLKDLSPQGVLFYDKDSVLRENLPLSDERLFPLPYKEILDEMNIPQKYRKLTSNMIYVGAVTAWLGIPSEILTQVLREYFADKIKALDLNLLAAQKGLEYFAHHLATLPRPYQVEDRPQKKARVLMDGNTASAMGLLFGGCSFVSWYPITPSTSVIEKYQELTTQYRKKDSDGKLPQAIVQSEDELAAICMVLGAGWAGARALTATSGPGLSLMAEAAGYAYYAEIPSVIWDVQRVGPSTGLPTRTLQGDLTFAHFLSHGDTRHVCLIPGTLTECFEFGQTCFDLAEQLQTLVIVLSDLDLGMNLWAEDKWTYPERPFQRGKILSLEELTQGAVFHRYEDVDGDGVPYRTLPGTPHAKAAYFTRGSGHNTKAQYTEDAEAYQAVMDRLSRKWETARTLVPAPVVHSAPNATEGFLYYGALDSVVAEACSLLTQPMNLCRVRALPFTKEVEQFLKDNQKIIVIDQNRDGQMLQLLAMEYPHLAHKLVSLRYHNGLPVSAENLRKDLTHELHATH